MATFQDTYAKACNAAGGPLSPVQVTALESVIAGFFGSQQKPADQYPKFPEHQAAMDKDLLGRVHSELGVGMKPTTLVLRVHEYRTRQYPSLDSSLPVIDSDALELYSYAAPIFRLMQGRSISATPRHMQSQVEKLPKSFGEGLFSVLQKYLLEKSIIDQQGLVPIYKK